MATYKRLTLQQRYLIASLYQQKKTQIDIAQQVGVSQETISRELASYRQQQPRQPDDAQQAQQRAATAKKRTAYKLNGPLLDTVIAHVRNRLSPEQICGLLYLRATRKVLHHETLYRYIYRHHAVCAKKQSEHETLSQYLRICHRKRYKDRNKPVRQQHIPNRVSIDRTGL